MKKIFWLLSCLIIISLVIAIWFIMTNEGQIPIHWNAAGEIDGYGSAYTMLLFPGISIFMLLLLIFVPKIDPKGDNINKSGPLLPFISIFITILMIGLQIITILSTYNNEFSGINIFMSLMFAILFGIMGYYLPNIKPNYTLGIKTPWTLADETTWTKTHKESGKWFMIVGLCFLICMFLKTPYNIMIPIVLVLIIVIGITIYSYIIFVQERDKKKK